MLLSYFLITSLVFSVWLKKFWNDSTTPKTDRISWVALLLGSVLWPVSLPFSILELATRKGESQPEVGDYQREEVLIQLEAVKERRQLAKQNALISQKEVA